LQVSHTGASTKVLAVEVTYHPAVDLAAGWPVLAELAQRIADLVGPEGPGQPGRCGYFVITCYVVFWCVDLEPVCRAATVWDEDWLQRSILQGS
jgi:hypothetical protein